MDLRLPLVLCLAAAASSCGPLAPPSEGAALLLGPNAPAWEAAGREAEAALAAGRWEEAAAAWERRIGLVPAAPGGRGPGGGILEAATRVDFYNLACVRALAGRRVAALDALDRAFATGTEPVGFDHLREDPDLASLRGDPRWEGLLRRLSWNGEVAVVGPAGSAPLPVVVVLDLDPAAAAEGPAPADHHRAVPLPPYRAGPEDFRWTTRLEAGERAAEKAVFAIGAPARAGLAADPARSVLVARGEGAVALAWEVLLRRPEAFARAVLDGPPPPSWRTLDRGTERVRTRVWTVGAGAGAPVSSAARAPDFEAALREALR
jgi:hypothetical protein